MAPRPIDVGLVDDKPFFNFVSGGFGSRVTVETDPRLKRRLGGLAYAITGVHILPSLRPTAARFCGEGFGWEGQFLALAIGNGRQAGGGIPLCPDALIDDGLLDLTILPQLDHAARLDAVSHLLREGAAGAHAELVTARSPWFEYEAAEGLNINLDSEPALLQRFRVSCPRALPIRLGQNPLFSRQA